MTQRLYLRLAFLPALARPFARFCAQAGSAGSSDERLVFPNNPQSPESPAVSHFVSQRQRAGRRANDDCPSIPNLILSLQCSYPSGPSASARLWARKGHWPCLIVRIAATAYTSKIGCVVVVCSGLARATMHSTPSAPCTSARSS